MAHDHSTLTESQKAEAAMDPYEEMPRYAEAVVILLCAAIFLFGIVNISFQYGQRRRVTIVRRFTAFGRFLSSRQHRLFNVEFPVLGSGLLILILSLFVFVWTFAKQPYYVSAWNVTGPPLAVRTGFFALGLFPFIVAFGAKWNIISFIVGVSHEKLQVFHQWLSQIFLVLSLLHTFPWCVAGLREIKPNTGGLSQLAWSWKIGKVYYWSGTAALIPLAWLCWASFSPIRNCHYEIFKLLHLISAALFFAFFFIHCNRLLGSWDYLYATLAVYGFSVLARFSLIFYRNGIHVPRAQTAVVAPGLLQITIKTKTKWSPGQHFFFNFITNSPFQSHPFTVSSVCNPNNDGVNEIILYVRKEAGMTAGLAALENRSAPVLLDGPYGGSECRLESYDSVLLVAGGIGVTFVLPTLQGLVRKVSTSPSTCPSVTLVWTLRRQAELDLISSELVAIQKSLGDRFKIFIHITSSSEVQGLSPRSEADVESIDSSENKSKEDFGHIDGRPNVREYVLDAVTAVDAGSLAVAACGPNSLTFDIRNAVADAQLGIARGTLAAREVYLHTEAFGW